HTGVTVAFPIHRDRAPSASPPHSSPCLSSLPDGARGEGSDLGGGNASITPLRSPGSGEGRGRDPVRSTGRVRREGVSPASQSTDYRLAPGRQSTSERPLSLAVRASWKR